MDLKIPRGCFFGLLGPNGAGKTTLISFLCGQVNGKYKKAAVLGTDRVRLSEYKQKIGYAPQEIALYPTLSAYDNLIFFAKLLGLKKTDANQVLEWIGLEDRKNEAVHQFSGGMKRRLNLGVALLNRPQLLILDEPTVGVDPQARNFIFERILELRKQGMTLIYSTHYLEEVQKLCDHVGILQNGKITASGPLSTVLGQENIEQRFLEITERGTADRL